MVTGINKREEEKQIWLGTRVLLCAYWQSEAYKINWENTYERVSPSNCQTMTSRSGHNFREHGDQYLHVP